MTARIYDLVLIIGLLVSGSGCGMWLLDRMNLRASSPLKQFLFASGLGLGILGYITFALGMLALYQHAVIATCYLALLLLGLWAWHSCGHFSIAVCRNYCSSILYTSWQCKILILYLCLLTGISLLAALAPVVGVDELIYRLAAAKIYLRHERLIYIPSMVFHMQPQHIQMIQIWGLALGSESTTQLVQWSMGVLLLLAVVNVGRREMPATWALVSGAIFYTYSDVIVLSGRASPDLANGFFMAMGVIAWLQWLETGVERWLLVAGALAGLFAAGTRLPGAYGAIALAALVCIYGWRHWKWKFTLAAKYGLAVGLVALLMVLPWYVRSYLTTGNPFWPFLGELFGIHDWTIATYELFTANYSQQEIGSWLSFRRILTAPWDLTIRPSQFHSGMAGPLVLATLPILLLVEMPQRAKRMLVACAMLGIMWYVSYPRLRAFIPGVAFLSIIVGYLLWRMWLSGMLPRWVRTAAIGVASTWLLVGLGTTMRFHLRAAGVTLGFQEEQDYLSQRLSDPDMNFYWFDDYQVLNKILPAGNRLLIYETRGYHLDFDYDYYTLIARRSPDPRRLRDQNFVVEQVHALGSDYILLWPEVQHGDGSEPNNLLENTLHSLCGSRWPIIYESNTMMACHITDT